MNQFEDLMIDLETMGNAPDGAIVSIGACFFSLKTEQYGPGFERKIHLSTAVRDGGKIDPGTVLFWLRQGDEARLSIAFGGEDIRVVLADFSEWIKETCRHEDVRPFGNSPRFDMQILESAYRRADMDVPWFWSKERDFRTMRAMYPQVEYNKDDKGSSNHTPLADAKFQIEHLFKIKRWKRGQA